MKASPTSYPRTKIKILLLENIADSAVEELKLGGYTDIQKLNGAISEEELTRPSRAFIFSASARKRASPKMLLRLQINCSRSAVFASALTRSI